LLLSLPLPYLSVVVLAVNSDVVVIIVTNTEGCVQSPVTQPQKVTPQAKITKEDGVNVQCELFSTPAIELIFVVPEDSGIGDGNGPLAISPLLPLAKGTEAMFLPMMNQSYLSLTQHKMLPTISTGPAKHSNNSADKQNLPEEASLHPPNHPKCTTC